MSLSAIPAKRPSCGPINRGYFPCQISRALDGAPRFPNYIIEENEIQTATAYWSQIMSTYCSEILSGDINTLEEIALKRQC